MRRPRVPAYIGLTLFFVLLLASLNLRQALHAQAPAAGSSVTVRMVEGIDSGKDPAGKQYRASVTRAVDAGNGVTIPRGAIAAVTLVNSGNGSGWTTQLVSLSINGQPVAVTSGPASVTSGARTAAASAVNSALGGFGHHVNAPSGVTAVAMGQRVVLPPGATLTFVLSQPPAMSPGVPGSPAPPSSQPVVASAAPAPAAQTISASSNGAGGPLTAMYICFGAITQDTMYLTAAFEVPVDTERSPPVIEPAFSAYLNAKYHYMYGITCQPIWSITDAQQAQKKLVDIRDRGNPKVVDTGWRYGQPPLANGQRGFDPLAKGPGGIDLTQHRLTTYYCQLDVAGGTTVVPPQPYNYQIATRYLSPVFQADWDTAPVTLAYKVYIRDHYVHDLNPSANVSASGGCGAQSPAMQATGHQSARVGTKLFGHVVPVDFTDTPAEAAAGNVVATQAASAASAAAAQTAAAKFFISCSTGRDGGIDTYYTGVFPIKNAKLTPNGYLVSPESQTVLNDFYAYLTQKGYKFKPNSASACDIARTEAAAQAAQHKRAYEGGGCSSCGKIVETGWKYTP